MRKFSIIILLLSILALALLISLSACRSAHSVCKVEESAQTTESSLSSAMTFSTMTDFISAFSLQADSIVMWLHPRPSSRTPVFRDSDDSTVISIGDTQSAGGCGESLPLASGSVPHNAPDAIKVYGLRVKSSASEQKSGSVQASDSVASEAKRDSASKIEDKRSPKEGFASRAYTSVHYFIYGAMAAAIALVIVIIRKRLKK